MIETSQLPDSVTAPRRSHRLAFWIPVIAMLVALAVALLAALVAPAPAHAQAVAPTTWIPDGQVNATLRSGTTLYLGGRFTRIGPPTGSFVATDAATGAADSRYPGVVGWVFAAVEDGAGGWYLGGLISAAGGQARQNLVHCLADGSTSSWTPALNSAVYSLSRAGNTLYCAGVFDSVDGQPRRAACAFDLASGALTAWAPAPNGTLSAVAAAGDRIFIAGSFGTVNGTTRTNAAAVDTVTGALLPWNAPLNGAVLAMAVSAGRVYLSGMFTDIGGASRWHLAATDTATGALRPWNPILNASSGFGIVYAFLPAGSTVVVGGHFNSVSSAVRNNLAALDTTTGLATAWDPNVDATVRSLALSGDTLWAGGDFAYVGGAARSYTAAVSLASGAMLPWNPDVSGAVYAVGTSANRVGVGGEFVTAGGVARNKLAALNLTTGLPTAWNPGVDSTSSSVLAFARSGNTIYVGGAFNSIGGVTRNNLAAFDVPTGNLTAWNPNADGYAGDLLLNGTSLIASGRFATIGGTSRAMLAALSLSTGAPTSWAPVVAGVANSYTGRLLLRGSTLYFGGSFLTVNGTTRKYAAAVDIATGALLPWNPNPNGAVSALEAGPGVIYLGGSFSAVSALPHARLVATDSSTGAPTEWTPAPNNTVNSLLRSGTVLYVGGPFEAIGSARRIGLAAMDVASGTLLSWAPALLSVGNVGPYPMRLSLENFSALGTRLLVSGSFGGVLSTPQAMVALMDPVAAPPIGWAGLIGPQQALLTTGSNAAYEYGEVWIGGVTDSPGQGAGVTAQLGYGPTGSDPATAPAWVWTAATYTGDDGGNDRYGGHITAAAAGTYDYCIRFSCMGGPWTCGDLGGTGNGYSSGEAGKLTVVDAPTVTWCNLQWPPTLTATSNTPTDLVFGQLWIPGITDSPGAGAGVAAQLGYGPPGSDPATGSGWTWTTAAYNTDHGNNDEYMARLTVTQTASATWSYAFRYSLDGGPWAYGDLDGTDNGYATAQAGTVTVTGTDGVADAGPRTLSFALASPSPAHGAARFRLGLPAAARVQAIVFDVAGRRVATLADGPLPAGWHELAWAPGRAGSGVYFARMSCAGRQFLRRIVIAN